MAKNSGNMKNINCSKIIGIQFSLLSPEEIRKSVNVAGEIVYQEV